MIWRVPIDLQLVPTSDRDHVVKPHQTHLPLSPHLGAFGVKRTHHTHEGVDLYCPSGTSVFAVESGTVVLVMPFTGSCADPPSPWWRDTEAVLVEGTSGVVVYGEVRSSVTVGDRIIRGDMIGSVVQVLTKDKGYPLSMLHLELHAHGTRSAYDWNDERPPSLLDPTPFLMASYLE
jgi:murein DD-endopeptidase MepM/ murein hydrolase activator NlpD